MPEEKRSTLVELPSGKIELVLVDGLYMALQFNCHCLDALKYCRAMCCRLRSGLNVQLEPEEVERLQHRPMPGQPGLFVLPGKPEDDSCVYLDSSSDLCKIQQEKPRMCQRWHCSPGGVGEGIDVRDGGWFLSPLHTLEMERARR